MNIDGKEMKSKPGMAATVDPDTVPGLDPGIMAGKRKLIAFRHSPLMKMMDEAGRER